MISEISDLLCRVEKLEQRILIHKVEKEKTNPTIGEARRDYRPFERLLTLKEIPEALDAVAFEYASGMPLKISKQDTANHFGCSFKEINRHWKNRASYPTTLPLEPYFNRRPKERARLMRETIEKTEAKIL